jgi:hypothetical protein
LGDDYFHFDPVKHLMLGERTSKLYRLGDRLVVQVARVSLDDRKVDFCFPKTADSVATPEKPAPKTKSAKKRAARKKKTALEKAPADGATSPATKEDKSSPEMVVFNPYVGQDGLDVIRGLMTDEPPVQISGDAASEEEEAKKRHHKRRRHHSRRRKE